MIPSFKGCRLTFWARRLEPLQSGAVIPSLEVGIVPEATDRLEPLQSGAVISSFDLARFPHHLEGLEPLQSGAVIPRSWRPGGRAARPGRSRTPSERGGGPYQSGHHWLTHSTPVSNPFVAGRWSLPECDLRWPDGVQVSNPFVAGRWSLRQIYITEEFCNVCFKPLRRGAVVPTMSGMRAKLIRNWFQTPSSRGGGPYPPYVITRPFILFMFQTPSSRGGGPYDSLPQGVWLRWRGFKPLRRGAVVPTALNFFAQCWR